MMSSFGDDRSNRIDPAMLDACHPDHRARYEFASDRVSGVVLDAGCGFGYGSAILAGHASRVVGIDVYDTAIAYATDHYAGPRVRFAVADVARFVAPEAPFDHVVCLEAIEHVEDDAGFVRALRAQLRAHGGLVISTPNRLVTSQDGVPSDPTHVREYSPRELEDLLRACGFDVVAMYGLHLAESVFARHRARSRLGAADRLGLRRLVPAAAKAAVVRHLVAADRDAASISDTDVEDAHGLLAVAACVCSPDR